MLNVNRIKKKNFIAVVHVRYRTIQTIELNAHHSEAKAFYVWRISHVHKRCMSIEHSSDHARYYILHCLDSVHEYSV
jgi:hypothetical protein